MKEFSFLTFPILKTERLRLRALTFDDATSIFELRSRKVENKLITRKTPKNLKDTAVMRIVVKEGFSMELANLLLENFEKQIAFFNKEHAHNENEEAGHH